MGSTVHAAVDATHGTAKVGLGLVASSRDGEGHLTLHGSTSLGGLDASSGEGTLGPGLKRSDLRRDLHVEDSTGALVHRLHLKDHAAGTTLTSTDSTVDGAGELVTHVVLTHTELTTALGAAGSVTGDNTEELGVLAGLLAGNGTTLAVQLAETATEASLGTTDGIESIEASAGGSSLHGGVASVLGNLVAGDGAVEADGGTGQLAGGHAAGLTSVTLELAEAGAEGGTHAAEVAGGLAAVLLDDRVETLVGLETLVLTTVTDVDNAAHLSVHAAVDAVLGLTVTLDGAGNLIDAGDHLEGGLGSTELVG